MAEVVEHTGTQPSNAKVNAALTTGIIGTSLAGLMILGRNGLGNILGSNCGCGNGCSNGCDVNTNWSLYNERKVQQNYVDLTTQFYLGQMQNEKELNQKFFDLYKMNVDNSFSVYKNHNEDSFALYKNQRDIKDDLLNRINEVDKKVDIMSAVRPYQDALINAKIDNVALVGDFNLARRTCRMITGELVLPSTPTVTGYPSYNPCNALVNSSPTTPAA